MSHARLGTGVLKEAGFSGDYLVHGGGRVSSRHTSVWPPTSLTIHQIPTRLTEMYVHQAVQHKVTREVDALQQSCQYYGKVERLSSLAFHYVEVEVQEL